MTASYRADVTAIGGRTGRVLSADGALRLVLGPQAGAEATNPEQLFAAAYAASFLDAIVRAAEARRVSITGDSNVTASVKRPADGTPLAVGLTIDLPGLSTSVAEGLVRDADEHCPFSAILRDKVPVVLTVS